MPVIWTGSVSESTAAVAIWMACSTKTSRATCHLDARLRCDISSGVWSRYCGNKSYTSMRWKMPEMIQYTIWGAMMDSQKSEIQGKKSGIGLLS